MTLQLAASNRRIVIGLTAGLTAAALAACSSPTTTTSSATPSVMPTTASHTSRPSSTTTTTGPASSTTTAVPTVTPTTTAPAPEPSPTEPPPPPAPVAGPPIMKSGDKGARVRELQARLKQIGWYSGDVSDSYGSKTEKSVSGFQTKREIAVTGAVDQTTWDKLIAMTRKPTTDELNNVVPKPAGTNDAASLDPRCLSGRVLCINKTSRKMTWVIDGAPQLTVDVRFGPEYEATREGQFSVFRKDKDLISNLYHTPMPFSMFFSGGQAIHYSANFARIGYNGFSHGCVNVRDYKGIQWLFGEVQLGDKVVIHR